MGILLIILVVLAVVLVVLAVVLLACAWLLYRIAFVTGRAERGEPVVPKAPIYAEFYDRMEAETEELKVQPFEQVSVSAPDGTPLYGRYYHLKDGAPLIIFFHGWRGHTLRDGCIGFQIGRELGFNVLLADQRGHGKSGGKCTTMGVKEREDCAEWARWAARRWTGTDIVLMGVSMGGATVLMAADRELPDEVKAIVADCGFTSPQEILCNCIPRMLPHLPIRLCYALGRLGARLFGRFDPNQADARKSLSVCKVPVLFLHGEADDFVPCRMSRQNCAACNAPKRLVTFPGAPHAASYYKQTERYCREVSAFLGRYLSAPSDEPTE
ncbi:MAG: alpha/beta hydrolase [Candidatus Coproplasma sp.]